jgi:hypothetical protein
MRIICSDCNDSLPLSAIALPCVMSYQSNQFRQIKLSLAAPTKTGDMYGKFRAGSRSMRSLIVHVLGDLEGKRSLLLGKHFNLGLVTCILDFQLMNPSRSTILPCNCFLSSKCCCLHSVTSPSNSITPRAPPVPGFDHLYIANDQEVKNGSHMKVSDLYRLGLCFSPALTLRL